MDDETGDADVARLAGDLARSLRDLRRAVEPDPRRPRPPTPRELLRFTDQVAIPAAILVLETNVRALELLQRTIRLADGRAPTAEGDGKVVRERAADLSRTTLARLDDALADLQTAVDGRPPDDEARRLLAEARALREEVDHRLSESERGPGTAPESGTVGPDEAVPVDVEAELRSIKDEVDDGDASDNS